MQSKPDVPVPWQWLSPIAGALAPAFVFFGPALLSHEFNGGLGGFSVWALRDLLLGYVLVLPALAVAWRLGVRHWVALWGVAAAMAAPLGYVIAHLTEFAWQPTEEELNSEPQWHQMFEYMALFGLSGVAYSLRSLPRLEVRSSTPAA